MKSTRLRTSVLQARCHLKVFRHSYVTNSMLLRLLLLRINYKPTTACSQSAKPKLKEYSTPKRNLVFYHIPQS